MKKESVSLKLYRSSFFNKLIYFKIQKKNMWIFYNLGYNEVTNKWGYKKNYKIRAISKFDVTEHVSILISKLVQPKSIKSSGQFFSSYFTSCIWHSSSPSCIWDSSSPSIHWWFWFWFLNLVMLWHLVDKENFKVFV